MTLTQQLQKVEIEQMICLGTGTIEQAKALHAKKMQILSRLNHERLVYHASSSPNWIGRMIKRFKVKQAKPQQSNN